MREMMLILTVLVGVVDILVRTNTIYLNTYGGDTLDGLFNFFIFCFWALSLTPRDQ